MRLNNVRVAVGVVLFNLCIATAAAAQVMDKVEYFQDSINEKGDLNHIIRLTGGSSWVLSEATLAPVASDLIVVMRDVMVEGKPVRAAWMFVGGEEIPAKHVEGVFPTTQAFLTRVTASEDQGTRLRLADGSELLVPGYNKFLLTRVKPPYKVLLASNRLSFFNLKDGVRVQVQPAK
jgi:hypothetical protein